MLRTKGVWCSLLWCGWYYRIVPARVLSLIFYVVVIGIPFCSARGVTVWPWCDCVYFMFGGSSSLDELSFSKIVANFKLSRVDDITKQLQTRHQIFWCRLGLSRFGLCGNFRPSLQLHKE
jgi:hypothetical protein